MMTEIRFIMSLFSVSFLIVTHLNKPTEARLHTLQLKNDIRTYFPVSSFGFYKGGYLKVHLKDFRFSLVNTRKFFGFVLDKTISDAVSPYLENNQDRCVFHDGKQYIMPFDVMLFTMDLINEKLKIQCSYSMQSIYISPLFLDNGTRRERAAQGNRVKESKITIVQSQNKVGTLSPNRAESAAVVTNKNPLVTDDKAKNKSSFNKNETVDSSHFSELFAGKQCDESGLEITLNSTLDKDGLVFETGFIIRITDESEEGLYNLYFHNCPTYKKGPLEDYRVSTAINLTIDIMEKNNNNYLSAGEMPLPSVYFFMSFLFFFSGCVWIFVLRKSSPHDVFRIHYLMALLIYVTSFCLLFHGINFHFIQSFGYRIEGWAILYYILHVLEGALFFITILFIGTGWAYIISEREKKIGIPLFFIIIIPLQILADLAEIIIQESKEGDYSRSAWRQLFILVDLLCCGVILFSVLWLLCRLRKATKIHGKEAINPKKLKLARQFYIMVVCYIYFSRILIYLLRIMVPFNYVWVAEMFRAILTLIYFVLTGYKFRPANNHPYLQLSQNDDKQKIEEVITRCGVTDSITKINRNKPIDT